MSDDKLIEAIRYSAEVCKEQEEHNLSCCPGEDSRSHRDAMWFRDLGANLTQAADRIAALLKEAEELKKGISLRRDRYNLAAGEVHNQQDEIASLRQSLAEAEGQIRYLEQRLSEAAEIIRPFAAVPPVTLSELDQIPLYAAHYWAVVGSPGKTHFTREDLARARDFLATMGDRHD
jgi:DNA repair exonuclease SbcCD ATPase subunit